MTDGLVDADRNPRPGLLDFKKVIEPPRITVGDDWAGFSLRNGQDFADTAFSFRYAAEADGGTLDDGTVTVAPLEAQAETHVPLPEPLSELAGRLSNDRHAVLTGSAAGSG